LHSIILNIKENYLIHKNDFDGNIVCGGKAFHESTRRDNILKDKKYPHYEYMRKVEGGYKPLKRYFQRVDRCPICSSNKFVPVLKKDGLEIHQCNECSFGFQNPRFKSKYLRELYQQEYSLEQSYSSPLQRGLDEIKYNYALQELYRFRTTLNSALDIGAGNFHFLNACRNAGITDLYGIEPRRCIEGEDMPFNIIAQFLDEIPENLNNISLISLWDTLEHVHDITKMITSCFRCLEQGGMLLILAPNLLSLASRLIRERSPTFCLYHLNYFTEMSLSKLLIDSGFTILKKETVISEIDNCRNYLEFQEPYYSLPRNEVAFAWLTPEYIHSNMLGSRLFFLATKEG
jgi:hypothetical protein